MAVALVLTSGGALCVEQASTLPPGPPPAATPEGRALQKVARQLRAVGITVDPAAIEVEERDRELTRADLRTQVELGLRSTHMEVLLQLRTILEATPPFRTVQSLRDQAVQDRLPDVQVYYVPERASMVFVEPEAQDEDRMHAALGRELVYAFYDQSPGGLTELLYEPQGLLDGVRVRRCLVEGHAALAELMVRHGGLDELGPEAEAEAELDPPPQHMHATLTELPCGDGTRFLYRRYQAGGWPAVLRAVRTPPPSSEQLMHPSKLDQDFPVNVAAPEWPKDAYGDEQPFGAATLTYQDILGEQTIYRLLVERGVEDRLARLASVGWDGDELRIYEHENGARIVIWRSVWDREIDAQQFATAIAPKGIEPRAFRVRRHGRVVDAVSTHDVELSDRLHAKLEMQPGEPTSQSSDGASTAAIEARLGG